MCDIKRLAHVLLISGFVMTNLTGCVLPPPPQEEPDVISSLILDLDRIVPLGAGPIFLERTLSSTVDFSVKNAVVGGPSPTLRYYWFIDFDVTAPTKWDSEEDSIVISGCHEKFIGGGGGTKTATVEVLLTEGILDVSLTKEDDPRFTPGGEPIHSVRWTVVITGTAQCQPNNNDVL
jgi:hypothetical protein